MLYVFSSNYVYQDAHRKYSKQDTAALQAALDAEKKQAEDRNKAFQLKEAELKEKLSQAETASQAMVENKKKTDEEMAKLKAEIEAGKAALTKYRTAATPSQRATAPAAGKQASTHHIYHCHILTLIRPLNPHPWRQHQLKLDWPPLNESRRLAFLSSLQRRRPMYHPLLLRNLLWLRHLRLPPHSPSRPPRPGQLPYLDSRSVIYMPQISNGWLLTLFLRHLLQHCRSR